MPAYIVTRIRVPSYEAWRPMFDQDLPRAREKATEVRVFRGSDDLDQIFILLSFDSLDDANEARDRLVSSRVLERFEDRHGPNVVLEP